MRPEIVAASAGTAVTVILLAIMWIYVLFFIPPVSAASFSGSPDVAMEAGNAISSSSYRSAGSEVAAAPPILATANAAVCLPLPPSPLPEINVTAESSALESSATLALLPSLPSLPSLPTLSTLPVIAVPNSTSAPPPSVSQVVAQINGNQATDVPNRGTVSASPPPQALAHSKSQVTKALISTPPLRKVQPGNKSPLQQELPKQLSFFAENGVGSRLSSATHLTDTPNDF